MGIKAIKLKEYIILLFGYFLPLKTKWRLGELWLFYNTSFFNLIFSFCKSIISFSFSVNIFCSDSFSIVIFSNIYSYFLFLALESLHLSLSSDFSFDNDFIFSSNLFFLYFLLKFFVYFFFLYMDILLFHNF